MNLVLVLCYCLLLGVISVYGTHRLWMVWQFLHHWTRMRQQVPDARFERLPTVTVQLPMFNERNVAERVIEAACRLDYPADRLEIQVLDDSTEDAAALARSECERLRADGHNIVYIHRAERIGFKAGALENGLRSARGEFIAVFDADFVPPSNFLRDTIDYFTDSSVGMVQTCWDHLNRDQSLLTRVQAMFLDGHFVVEQTARAASNRWFNFNGTAGIWRRSCIEDAGGWHHDTLTEDTDLSYRAQLAGWRFRYLPAVRCPAEIPPRTTAFLTQQHRWNKGLVETAVKLLPRILTSRTPWTHRLEAWFHLTSPIMYIAVLLISLLLPIAMLSAMAGQGIQRGLQSMVVFWAGMTCLMLGTFAVTSFYLTSQWAVGQPLLRSLFLVPLLMAVGVGISVLNTGAVVTAILRRRSPFVRTPKFNQSPESETDPFADGHRGLQMKPGVIELVLAALMAACLVLSASSATILLIGVPFVALFLIGFGWIGLARVTTKAGRPIVVHLQQV